MSNFLFRLTLFVILTIILVGAVWFIGFSTASMYEGNFCNISCWEPASKALFGFLASICVIVALYNAFVYDDF